MPGRYELAEPLVFAPEDSGTAESRTVFAAAPGDEGRAVLSGGRVVSGWKAAARPARGVGRRPPRAEGRLAVPPRLGRRPVAGPPQAPRRARPPPTPWPGSPAPTRTPRMTPLPTASNMRRGQVDPGWTSLRDVEVVVPHFWLDSHLKIAAVDPDRKVVTLDRPSQLQVHRRASAPPRPLLPRRTCTRPSSPASSTRIRRPARCTTCRARGSRRDRSAAGRPAAREPRRVPRGPGLGPVRRASHPARPDPLRCGLGARPARVDGLARRRARSRAR